MSGSRCLTGGSRAALPRQQTLRAMVDWSWELLTGAERAVLARLSVFAGGFGLAAAEAVAAGPDVPAAEVAGASGRAGGQEPGPVRRRRDRPGPVPAAGNRPAVRGRAAGRAGPGGGRRPPGSRTAITTWPWPRRPPRSWWRADQAAWLDRLDAELGNLRAAIAVQPDPGRPGAGPAAGRLAAGVLAGPRARRRRSRRAAGAAGHAGRPGGDAAARPGAGRSGPPPPADGRLRDRRGLLRGGAGHCPRRRGRLPGRRPAARRVPGSCCARGSPAPRCRSSSRAWAWPAASGNPT